MRGTYYIKLNRRFGRLDAGQVYKVRNISSEMLEKIMWFSDIWFEDNGFIRVSYSQHPGWGKPWKQEAELTWFKLQAHEIELRDPV